MSARLAGILPLRRSRSRIACLEVRLAEQERRIGSLCRILGAVYDAEGIPRPADLGGEPARAVQSSRDRHGLYAV